jgi:hypothetical protein
MKPVSTAPGTMLLKLRYNGPLSNFAFNFNLYRYNGGVLAGNSSPEDWGRCSSSLPAGPRCLFVVYNVASTRSGSRLTGSAQQHEHSFRVTLGGVNVFQWHPGSC